VEENCCVDSQERQQCFLSLMQRVRTALRRELSALARELCLILERERKGEMRVREMWERKRKIDREKERKRERERKRPERIGEENAHDDRSLWNIRVTA
jgi:hypothetical protein